MEDRESGAGLGVAGAVTAGANAVTTGADAVKEGLDSTQQGDAAGATPAQTPKPQRSQGRRRTRQRLLTYYSRRKGSTESGE